MILYYKDEEEYANACSEFGAIEDPYRSSSTRSRVFWYQNELGEKTYLHLRPRLGHVSKRGILLDIEKGIAPLDSREFLLWGISYLPIMGSSHTKSCLTYDILPFNGVQDKAVLSLNSEEEFWEKIQKSQGMKKFYTRDVIYFYDLENGTSEPCYVGSDDDSTKFWSFRAQIYLMFYARAMEPDLDLMISEFSKSELESFQVVLDKRLEK